jgi:hypothetical protein
MNNQVFSYMENGALLEHYILNIKLKIKNIREMLATNCFQHCLLLEEIIWVILNLHRTHNLVRTIFKILGPI